MKNNFDKILVLDFGSQYNQLITRRIRELGVYAELKSHKITANEIEEINPKALIFSGGPNSVYGENAFTIDPEIYNLGLPILGICYGMQLLAKDLPGGKVSKSESNGEYGQSKLTITKNDSPLFTNLSAEQNVLMSHGDYVSQVPDGFEIIGTGKNCPIAAMQNVDKKIYALQFHPEVRLTEHGYDILQNFILNVVHANDNWTMDNFIDMKIQEIRNEVGDKKVILGISGGVDSSVVAVLLQKAIGNQLVAVFVDHGLLRKNEAQQVLTNLRDAFGINIVAVDAGDEYLSALKGVTDPEKKRKIIGVKFIDIFSREAEKLSGIEYLAQGTLYTDVIESGTDTAQTIKSHHNVGGLPEKLGFKLIEPLNKLFKDEVRKLGELLGIPHQLVWRQPFPGPGLAIRTLGEVTESKLRLVRESDAILREEFANAHLNETVWQYFTVLPGIKSVGVMGDGRTYDDAIIIRAINSIDGMTAESAQVPWDILDKIAKRIVNEVSGINRVLYDLTGKPPATIEYE